MPKAKQQQLSAEQSKALLQTLQNRFNKHAYRHFNLSWHHIAEQLGRPGNNSRLYSLFQMEASGGEPDVVTIESDGNSIVFYDCAAESPKGRRSLCYDRAALDARKEFKPADTVIDMAAAMGVELLDETQYRALQAFGPFDTKTSSWIVTPPAIRKLEGALFGDHRYGHVFVYHNGASSYYAARGFRGRLTIG